MGLQHAPLFLLVILGSSLQTRQDNPTITVERCQHTDVLLECNCSNMTHGLKWQKNDTLIYLNNRIVMGNTYSDRIQMFDNENPQNCSILLENITEEDGGIYWCNFKEGEPYSQNKVTLQVNMNSTECPVPETRNQPSFGVPPTDPERTSGLYFAFIIIPAVLLFGYIFIVLRKRRRDQLHDKQEVESVGCHFYPPLII